MHPSCPKESSDCITPPGKNEVDPLLDPAEEALEAAKVSVYREARLKICLKCLGNKNLPMEQRIHEFHTLGDLGKHFRR